MACKFSTIHTPFRILIYGPRSFETPPWEHSLAGKEERMDPLISQLNLELFEKDSFLI